MEVFRKLALLWVTAVLLIGYASIQSVKASTIDPDVLKYGGPPLVSDSLAREAELKSLHYKRVLVLAERVKRDT